MFDLKKTAADVTKLEKEIAETIGRIENCRRQKLERVEGLQHDMETNADAMNVAMETGDQESFIQSQMRQEFLRAQIEKIEASADGSDVQEKAEKIVRKIDELMKIITTQANAFVPEIMEQAEKEHREMIKQYDKLRKLKIEMVKMASGKNPPYLGSFGGPLTFNARVKAALKSGYAQLFR